MIHGDGGSGGVWVGGGSGEASGESTPRAETPDRFDEEKWRKQEQKKAERLEKKMRQDEERRKSMEVKQEMEKMRKAEMKLIRLKEKRKMLEDSMHYYEMADVKRGVPMR